ncbi:hypothetical protein KPZU09_60510 [Klebsiella pneumoniae]|uniref:Uncharacterized protein n=1 Tax=Klebsiella pneumoniae TaxID=573 RepID=A0A919HY42_KLEPN|nr:hypothetical protein KPZU09_60510 [Klebsiella pneumoniae]
MERPDAVLQRPPAAAIVDRNCFSVSLYSAQKPGDVAFIRVASYYPVTMFSQVRTLARGSSEAQYCELDVVPGDLNRYTLTGCLPQRSEPLPLAFAIQDGASYAGAILKAELAGRGSPTAARCCARRWPMSPAPCWQPASRLRCTICCGSC